MSRIETDYTPDASSSTNNINEIPLCTSPSIENGIDPPAPSLLPSRSHSRSGCEFFSPAQATYPAATAVVVLLCPAVPCCACSRPPRAAQVRMPLDSSGDGPGGTLAAAPRCGGGGRGGRPPSPNARCATPPLLLQQQLLSQPVRLRRYRAPLQPLSFISTWQCGAGR